VGAARRRLLQRAWHGRGSAASGDSRNSLSDLLAIVSRGSAEAMVVLVDLDELVDHWTLLKDERELIAGKRGPTRLGFALLLKFAAFAHQTPGLYSRAR